MIGSWVCLALSLVEKQVLSAIQGAPYRMQSADSAISLAEPWKSGAKSESRSILPTQFQLDVPAAHKLPNAVLSRTSVVGILLTYCIHCTAPGSSRTKPCCWPCSEWPPPMQLRLLHLVVGLETCQIRKAPSKYIPNTKGTKATRSLCIITLLPAIMLFRAALMLACAAHEPAEDIEPLIGVHGASGRRPLSSR